MQIDEIISDAIKTAAKNQRHEYLTEKIISLINSILADNVKISDDSGMFRRIAIIFQDMKVESDSTTNGFEI
jgi:hypothetical protein